MKLEFNPSKRYYKDSDTIYLLDEPGSYLHSSAQKNLLLALQKLARNNKVIFTTHTPFLLDPNKIKLNDIRIATKSDSMEIELYNIATVPKKIHGKNSPFQILMHYLEITPLSYNYSKSNVVIVEGIIDYYAFEMFKEGREMSFFPSHNADSTVFHISYMIADSKNYSVLWDNDTNGIEGYKKAKKSFGEVEARKWMFLPIDKGNKRILQDLFDSKDLSFIKTELDMKGSSFDKTITVLYHSKAKNTILKKLKGQTKSNFDEIFKRLEAILK